MIVIQDDFTGINGTHIEDRSPVIGSWVLRGDWAIIHTNKLTNDNYYNSYYNADMPISGDQSATLIFSIVTYEGMTLLLRMSLTDPLNGYGFSNKSGIAEFVRYDIGVKIVLSSFPLTLVNGDVVKFDIIGAVLSAYVNGILISSVTDTAHAAGVIGFLCAWAGSAQSWDDFIGEISGEAIDHMPLCGVH